MNLGVQLTILIGPKAPLPAPPMMLEALDSVEVTHDDEGRSGFQITLRADRADPAEIIDYSLLSLPLLRPFNRVIMIISVDYIPFVLMDGIITHQQLSPGNSTLVITGEDVSVMMDMKEKSAEYPGQTEIMIATRIIMNYADYGLKPVIIPPPSLDVPLPIERTPVQQGTDLSYLKEMAQRYGYVFYINPGPLPFTNTAYWGPPVPTGLPQSALSVNMDSLTNVESLTFKNNALVPTVVSGIVQDRLTNMPLPVQTFALLTRMPPLASQPSIFVNQPNVRSTQFRHSGLSTVQALSRAQGITDAAGEVVTAEGELNAVRYGNILKARGMVGVRGAGYTFDGFYYVKRVKHIIKMNQYKQQFTLTREGVGSTTPVVVP